MNSTVTLTLSLRQAEILSRAAGQMEDDWCRQEGQSWRSFESSTGVTREDHDAFHHALNKLHNACIDVRSKGPSIFHPRTVKEAQPHG